MKRRFFLYALPILLTLGVFLYAAGSTYAAQSPQIPLPGASIPKFVNQLPLLSVAGGTMQTVFGNVPLMIGMEEFKTNILPPGTPLVDNPATTLVPDGTTYTFGYVAGALSGVTRDTYLGPVIVNSRGAVSTDITFVNNLGSAATTNVLAIRYGTDQTLHWADPLGGEANTCNKAGGIPTFGGDCAQNYLGPIPGVPHLHGGEVPPELDGGPDAWWTSDGRATGHAYYSADGLNPKNYSIYKYPNTQEAAPIWFHDHVLGMTRLNVYAGLAGAYLITDPALTLPAGLHPAGLQNGAEVEYTVPLVIQDRMFDTEGQLFYTSDSAGGVLWVTNPEHPYWTPEFLGDVIVVNGKAWPNLDVKPKRYRFWLINGSNARTYEIFLADPLNVAVPPNMWVIATDGGYLDQAVMTKKLVIMPGERYEVIMDFAGVAPGTKLIMRNTAKSPYPAGVPPQGATTGQVMQFTVGSAVAGFVDNTYNPAITPAIRSTPMVRLPTTAQAASTRVLSLNEVMGMPQVATDPVTGVQTAYPGGPLEVLVNNTKYTGESTRTYNDFIPIPTGTDVTKYSELPTEGSFEVWEIVNLTADAHPIHLHLVQFQIINRQNFNFNTYNKVYNAAFPGGVFVPGFGPPLPYDPATGVSAPAIDTRNGKQGGNPDVTPYLQGKAQGPLPQEAGWKDTVIVYPSQVTRLAVRWAPTDVPAGTEGATFNFDPNSDFAHGYVWHCHIIDHEDNEMMRPFTVKSLVGATRSIIKGVNY